VIAKQVAQGATEVECASRATARGWVVPTLLVVAFMVVAAALALRAAALRDPVGHPDAVYWAFQDFRDAVYYPVVAWRAGDNPYDVSAYRSRYPVGDLFPLFTPTTLILHSPIGALPYRVAEGVYFALNVGLTLVLAALSLAIAGRRPRLSTTFGIGVLILLSRPGHWNLMLGQPTLIIVLGVVLALGCGRTRPFTAGLGLALAFVKPNFGMPLALLLVAMDDVGAALVGVAVTGVIGLAVSAQLAAAAGGIGPFVATLRDNATRFDAGHGVDPVTSPFRVDLPALLARCLDAAPGPAVDLVIALVVLALAAVAVRRAIRADDRVLALGVAVLAMLVSTYHLSYDLLLLVPVVVALVVDGGGPSWRAWPRLRTAALAACAALACNYLSTERVLSRLQPAGSLRLVILASSPVLLGMLWAVYTTVAMQAPSARDPEHR